VRFTIQARPFTIKHMGFATTAIHSGQEPDQATGSVTVPIYQTSTYAQEGLGRNKGYEYARTQNPTRSALEQNLAALEGARFGFAFASGMAAIDATLRLVKAGEHVVVSDNTYGGTFRLFTKVLANYSLEFDFVDTSEPLNVEATSFFTKQKASPAISEKKTMRTAHSPPLRL
jgi:cystathionine beta-lyase/cystathionine gamma-synthase